MEKFKWTDAEQASDRLVNCYITFNGVPVRVIQIGPATGDIEIYYQDHEGHTQRALSADPGWRDFREMPRLGWINVTDGAGGYTGVHVSRLPARHRKHGLTRENTRITSPDRDGGTRHLTIDSVLNNAGYRDETYASVSDIIENALEREAYAVSKSYGVYKDNSGLFWLYRHMHRLGVVTEDAGLRLFPKSSYVTDEIEEEIPQVFSRVEIL